MTNTKGRGWAALSENEINTEVECLENCIEVYFNVYKILSHKKIEKILF